MTKKPSNIYVLAAQLSSQNKQSSPTPQTSVEDIQPTTSPLSKLRQRISGMPSVASRSVSAAFNKVVKPQVSIITPVFNKVELTLACLESLSKHSTKYSFELIIIDNASSDATPQIISPIDGIHYVRNDINLGFVEACNQGAMLAKGDILVFLNNDTVVVDNWLDALVDRLSDETIGLVGSKLIYPDGRLQEAGGIIFSDGSGMNYGKYEDSGSYMYNFSRDVDYCSGASIAIARDDFIGLGMFDMLYAPAYYEDADLSMKVHQSGKRVVYVPQSVLVHIEGGTSGTDLNSGFKRFQSINHAKFLKKWSKVLKENHSKPGTSALTARHYGKIHPHILIVDSMVPEYNKDAGSLRMTKIIDLSLSLGAKVTLYADNLVATAPYTAELHVKGVEVVYGKEVRLQEFYETRKGMYQTIILSRPLTVSSHIDLARAYQETATIYYDTVDLHFLRVRRSAELSNNKVLFDEANKWQELELALMEKADYTLVVSTAEVEILKTMSPQTDVKILSLINPSNYEASTARSFEDRSGLLFIGSSHPPNEDAILWFVDKIFPKIKKAIPGITLTLLGSNPSQKVMALASKQIIVPGFIDDISDYFNDSRVFVSPLRYGAGVKGKVIQSISFGLPIVSTDLGVEGSNMNPGKDCLVANTAEDFTKAVITAYTDQKIWESIQKNELKTFNDFFSEQAGLRSLGDIIGHEKK